MDPYRSLVTAKEKKSTGRSARAAPVPSFKVNKGVKRTREGGPGQGWRAGTKLRCADCTRLHKSIEYCRSRNHVVLPDDQIGNPAAGGQAAETYRPRKSCNKYNDEFKLLTRLSGCRPVSVEEGVDDVHRKISSKSKRAGRNASWINSNTGPSEEEAKDTDATQGGGLDPGELVQGGGCAPFRLPTEILGVRRISDVLSVEVWRDCLTSEERRELRKMLPANVSSDPAAEEGLLRKLFSGAQDFHFGNQATKVWRKIQTREAHPKVVRHKEVLSDMQRKLHFHKVRVHHNRHLDDKDAMARQGYRAFPGLDGRSKEEWLQAWKGRPVPPPRGLSQEKKPPGLKSVSQEKSGHHGVFAASGGPSMVVKIQRIEGNNEESAIDGRGLAAVPGAGSTQFAKGVAAVQSRVPVPARSGGESTSGGVTAGDGEEERAELPEGTYGDELSDTSSDDSSDSDDDNDIQQFTNAEEAAGFVAQAAGVGAGGVPSSPQSMSSLSSSSSEDSSSLSSSDSSDDEMQDGMQTGSGLGAS